MMKKCGKCKKIKDDIEFNICRKSSKDGLQHYCIECSNKLIRKRIINYKLKSLYTMDSEEFNKILESQNGCCAICKMPKYYKNFSIDHNHETGELRGLLCISCNSILGFANDDIEILQKAVEYLKRSPLKRDWRDIIKAL